MSENIECILPRLEGSTSLREELEYTASMLREMREMAAARRDLVRAYFIEMAYVETCDQLRALHDSESDKQAQAA